MSDITLNDCWAKFRRAENELRVLQREIQIIQDRQGHRISIDRDADGGQYVVRVHDLPLLDESWGVRIGEIVHNARTSLDYLIVRLVALGTGLQPAEVENVRFPILSEPHRFADWRKGFTKTPLLDGWVSRIEELQPFNSSNPSIWGWDSESFDRQMPLVPLGLARLQELDNVDKHRGILRPQWAPRQWGGPLNSPPDFRPLGEFATVNPVVDGSQITRARFGLPFPYEWMPDEGDVKRSYPLEVSMPNPVINQPVIELLRRCLSATEWTLTIFQPIFSDQETPLPVTVTLPPRIDT